MESRRFDSLVRTFAAASTRRRVLAVLAALPLVSEILGLAPDEAAAEKPRDRIKRRKDANRRKRRNRKRCSRERRDGQSALDGGWVHGAVSLGLCYWYSAWTSGRVSARCVLTVMGMSSR